MFGLSIAKPDGSEWISPGFTPQCLINKGYIPATKKSVFQTVIPSGKSCFFFVKTQNKSNVMYTHEQINGCHALRLHTFNGNSPGTTTVYAFGNMVTPPSEYGIAMYNPGGEIIYHGEMMLLDAKLIPVGIKFDIDLGYPCAIMPALVGYYNWKRTPYDRPIYTTSTGATGNKIYSCEHYSGNATRDIYKPYIDKVLVINSSIYD
ncbi:hypothetical protein ORA01_003455 [Escherichia coli]|nr:hypothetical protein [Escherichia coli]